LPDTYDPMRNGIMELIAVLLVLILITQQDEIQKKNTKANLVQKLIVMHEKIEVREMENKLSAINTKVLGCDARYHELDVHRA